MRPAPLRSTLPVLGAFAIVLAAGGGATASNMGFKLNKSIVNGPILGPNDNWTSIPYSHVYGSMAGFCSATGLRSVIGSQARLTWINPSNNLPTTVGCGTSVAVLTPMPPAGIGPPTAPTLPSRARDSSGSWFRTTRPP